MRADELALFMTAVSTSNEWLDRPPDLGDVNDVPDRRGGKQWAWRNAHLARKEVLMPMNNRTRVWIPRLMLPLIITDILLHVSQPSPAPIVERSSRRTQNLINDVCFLFIFLGAQIQFS
jgi:hypothetical protein